MSLSTENKRITRAIRRFCTDHVLERKRLDNDTVYDDYKGLWLETIGNPRSGETISKRTVEKICEEIKASYPEVEVEHRISGTNLAFDIYYPPTSTAFEICLGAVTKEFHKDILKAMLDQDTHVLIFMYREYKYGKGSQILGEKWFAHPAQKELIKLTGVHKLKTIPIPLVLAE